MIDTHTVDVALWHASDFPELSEEERGIMIRALASKGRVEPLEHDEQSRKGE
jgi:hypothetical protein